MSAAASASAGGRAPDNIAREQFYPVLHARPPWPDGGPLRKARNLSKANGRLPIWAEDIPPREAADKGKKRFVVGSYSAFQDYYRMLAPSERCVYEIISTKLPTRLYVDVDMQRSLNPTLTDDAIQSMKNELVAEIRALMAEIRGGDAPGTDVECTVLDSSTTSKLSKHMVFDFFLENNYHCGAFMLKVRNRLVEKHEKKKGVGDCDEDHRFYVWTEKKAPDPTKPNSNVHVKVRAFFGDLAVYTKRRNFRIYGSRKRVEGGLPLFEDGGDGAFDWDTFKKCLLQRWDGCAPVHKCLHPDGGEPYSTSNLNLFRTDPQAVKTAQPTRRAPSRALSSVAKSLEEAPHLVPHWTNVFPFDVLFDILAPPTPPPRANPESVWRRDFRLADAKGVWTRARFFDTHQDFRTAVLAEKPATIHVGAVVEVTDASGDAKLEPVDQEPWQPTLAFDVDIRDYAKWRPCCGDTGAACTTCWPIAAFAQDALSAFVEHIGLGRAVCFFSGNKGIHVWVVDSDGAILGKPARRAMLRIFTDVIARRTSTDAETTGPPDYKAFATTPFVQQALGSQQKRERLKRFICSTMGQTPFFEKHAGTHGKDSAILHYLWPRVDEEVTVTPGHKIKAPMCIHPNTSRLCMWLESGAVNPYDPEVDVTGNTQALRAHLKHN